MPISQLKVHQTEDGIGDAYSLATKLTEIGAVDTVLILNSGTYTVSAALSGAANVTLYLKAGAQVVCNDDVTFAGPVIVEGGGVPAFSVAVGKALTLNGSLEAGLYQVFTGAGSVSFGAKAVKRVYPQWFGAVSNGSTDDTSEIQAAADSLATGGCLYIPKGSSYYVTSNTIDFDVASYVTVEFEPGAEIRINTASKHLIKNTQTYFTINHATLQGQGTFVHEDNTGKALIISTAHYTTIRHCYLKDAENQFIKIGLDQATGATHADAVNYATIEYNILEGGPELGDLAVYPNSRTHLGIWLYYSDYSRVNHNILRPNSSDGCFIQGIDISASFDNEIIGNYIEGAWDHAIYANLDGSVVSDNIIRGSGIKIIQAISGTSRGNVVNDNNVDVNAWGVTGFKGDQGVKLDNPQNSTCVGNTVKNASDAGIILVGRDSPYIVRNNVVANNTVDTVKRGNASADRAFGIQVTSANTFVSNVITGNTIRNIGDPAAFVGFQSGINIENNDTDAHTNNKITNNIIDGCTGWGVVAWYLTNSEISHNTISNIGTAKASQGIWLYDVQQCRLESNRIYGVGAQMQYGIEEGAANCGYNEYINNFIYNSSIAPINRSNFASTNTVRGTSVGTGDVSVYATAGDRVISAADLWLRTHLRDPNGAARVDTTDTAVNITIAHLPYDGCKFEIDYLNTGAAAETITISPGAGVTMYNNEGAGDLVVSAGDAAKLTFIRISATAVSVLGTVFEAV